MRIFTNQQHIKTKRRNAQIMFFASFGILGGGLIVSLVTNQKENPILMLIPCVVLPFGLVTTWISVRLSNQYVRVPHPEDAIQAGLKGINQNSVLYNYLFKANHVLVAPEGVFAFVTRFQDGPLKIEGEQVIDLKARGPIGKFMSLMRQEQMGNPLGDVLAASTALQPYIDTALPGAGVTVQPVIVFTSPKIIMEVTNPAVPMVMVNPKKKPSLKSLLKDSKRQTALLTPAQLSAIEKQLNASLSIEGAPEETQDSSSSDE